jgi:hypothetical protein
VFSDNPLHGRTLNPRDPTLSAGGSSGGAGAAVATGIGPIAQGNDIGGSVRIPALYNGIVGLRVSLGRIPSYNPSQPGARPIGVQLMAVEGPLARSVRDARLALAAMARGDPVDTRWADAPLAGPPVLRPIHVALVAHNPGGFTHPAQAEAVRQAGRHLAAAGYAVEEVAPPDLDEIIETYHRILATDVLRVMAPLVEESGDADARASTRLMLELVPPTDLDGVLTALAKRDLFLGRWLTFMRRYPLVVMPTVGDLAPPHNLDTTREGQARVLDSLRVGPVLAAAWRPRHNLRYHRIVAEITDAGTRSRRPPWQCQSRSPPTLPSPQGEGRVVGLLSMAKEESHGIGRFNSADNSVGGECSKSKSHCAADVLKRKSDRERKPGQRDSSQFVQPRRASELRDVPVEFSGDG